jgi:hypothetical protein
VLDYEEPALFEKFGDEYSRYRVSTPFLIPRARLVAADINWFVSWLGRNLLGPAIVLTVVFLSWRLLKAYGIRSMDDLVFTEANAKYVLLAPVAVTVFLFLLSVAGSVRLLAAGAWESPGAIFMMGFRFMPVPTGISLRLTACSAGLPLSLQDFVAAHGRGKHLKWLLRRLSAGSALLPFARAGFEAESPEAVAPADTVVVPAAPESSEIGGVGIVWTIWAPTLLGIFLGGILVGFKVVRFPVLTTTIIVFTLVLVMLSVIFAACFAGSLWLSSLGVSFPTREMFRLGFCGYPVKDIIFALAAGAKAGLPLMMSEILPMAKAGKDLRSLIRRIRIFGAISRTLI